MTKFRQNHQRAKRGGNSFMLRIGLFSALLIGGLLFGYISLDDVLGTSGQSNQNTFSNSDYEAPIETARTFLPSVTGKNQRVDHKHYSYSHSGYTRGHMAPAGDMAFSETAMKETFYMSNMTPQIRPFNNGIWKELEEQTRDWAYKKDDLIVISGPIINGINERIGKNDIGVPKSFFKILVDGQGRSSDAIGFIIPHDKSDKRLQEYAVNIDEIERQTGIDFFDDYFEEDDEEAIEGSFNINKWNFDNARYRRRVEKWNNE